MLVEELYLEECLFFFAPILSSSFLEFACICLHKFYLYISNWLFTATFISILIWAFAFFLFALTLSLFGNLLVFVFAHFNLNLRSCCFLCANFIFNLCLSQLYFYLSICLLAPQSGALRINAYRDFLPIQSHPYHL